MNNWCIHVSGVYHLARPCVAAERLIPMYLLSPFIVLIRCRVIFHLFVLVLYLFTVYKDKQTNVCNLFVTHSCRNRYIHVSDGWIWIYMVLTSVKQFITDYKSDSPEIDSVVNILGRLIYTYRIQFDFIQVRFDFTIHYIQCSGCNVKPYDYRRLIRDFLCDKN